MRRAVGTRAIDLKYAPPRTKGPGFSIVLPAGWETRRPEGVDFTAVKTSSLEAAVSFVVVRGPKDIAFETDAACAETGAQMSKRYKGKLVAAKLVDGACMVRFLQNGHDTLTATVPDGPNKLFMVICDGMATDKTVMDDCPAILSSWKTER